MKALITLLIALLVVLAPRLAAAQCEGISVSADPDLVRITHDASFNCGVFDLRFAITLDADTLKVDERAVAHAWMDCYCPYHSEIAIMGLGGGDHVLQFQYAESLVTGPPAAWHVCVMPFTVPGADGPPGELIVETEESGCGITPTGAPEMEIHLPASWTALKGIY
ncbi:hypothetical protein GF314_01645 [bacterium]|nr:hypothetical protein [bacterium]